MPKLVLAAFCERVIVDQSTNNLSIINQLDELQVPRTTVQQQLAALTKNKKGKKGLLLPLTLSFVTLWERDKPTMMESTELKIHFIAPSGKRLGEFTGIVNLRKHRRWRSLTNLPALPITDEGTYQFKIKVRSGLKWKLIRTVTYQLHFRDTLTTVRAQSRSIRQ